MAEHGGEHLPDAQRVGALLQLPRELLLLAPQLEEDLGLALQDVRLDGLEEEVDRTAVVALELAVPVVAAGGDEDDGHVARALHAAHHLGELEAVHLGHLHVDEGERHVVHEQDLQRFGARAGLQQLHLVVGQQGREGVQVFCQVVDQQAFHLRARRGVTVVQVHVR